MNKKLNELALAMIRYEDDVERIQHFTKVHAYSKLIGELEGLDEQTQFILEAAAYVHDIGIKPALVRYGSGIGRYQEELGPDVAEQLLSGLGFERPVIERVKYLVGHHHTYTNIDGIDYQILVEADFMVNLFENHESDTTVSRIIERIFRTESGIRICRDMFGL